MNYQKIFGFSGHALVEARAVKNEVEKVINEVKKTNTVTSILESRLVGTREGRVARTELHFFTITAESVGPKSTHT